MIKTVFKIILYFGATFVALNMLFYFFLFPEDFLFFIETLFWNTPFGLMIQFAFLLLVLLLI